MITLSSDQCTYNIQIGPAWYTNEVGLNLKPGDQITVVGVPVEHNKNMNFIARQICFNSQTYTFRNAQGVPLWAGADSKQFVDYGNAWNPNSTIHLTGVIQKVSNYYPGPKSMGPGTEIRVLVTAPVCVPGEAARPLKPVIVHLGPCWYVAEKLVDLCPGQQVDIQGSYVRVGKHDVVIAQQITRENQMVQLRSPEGFPAWGGGWQNWSGWGPAGPYATLYNPSAPASVVGQVKSVEKLKPPCMGEGYIATVYTTDCQTVQVVLGPSWFIDQNCIPVGKAFPVSFDGAMACIEGCDYLVARDFNYCNQLFVLRLDNGAPMWVAGSPEAPWVAGGPGAPVG